MKKLLYSVLACLSFSLFANDDVVYYKFTPEANPRVPVKDSMIRLSAGKTVSLNLPDAADWGDLKMKFSCRYKLGSASAVNVKAEFKTAVGTVQTPVAVKAGKKKGDFQELSFEFWVKSGVKSGRLVLTANGTALVRDLEITHTELAEKDLANLVANSVSSVEPGLVEAPQPTAEELAAAAIKELKKPVTMTVKPGNKLLVTAVLANGKTIQQEFSVPMLTIRKASKEYCGNLSVHGKMPNKLNSCYGGLIAESVRITCTDMKITYQKGKDFTVNAKMSRVSKVKTSAMKFPVYFHYSYRWHRIDSVILKDGKLSYRTGKEVMIIPAVPALNPGEVRVANVYLSPDTTKLTEGNCYPISEQFYPVKRPPVADKLLPKTMKKLRNGEPILILAWGDSITNIGYEIPNWKKARWQVQFVNGLKKRFPNAKIKLVTEAWGGHNSNHYLDPKQNPGPGMPHNYQERILNRKPDLIVSEWFNDGWMSYSLLTGSKSNYKKMLYDFRKIGAEWIIITPQYGSPYGPFDAASQKNIVHRSQYLSFLRQFAPANRIPLADVSARYVRLSKQGVPVLALGTYGVHPGQAGLKVFADALLDLFPEK
ncbi:MAG: SGNH/GDSL hydrolase family protein [Lentisphaerae bacterium]|nr:SGNH/GDSL hydrolase family protein [Lentisphaerota bacterium]